MLYFFLKVTEFSAAAYQVENYNGHDGKQIDLFLYLLKWHHYQKIVLWKQKHKQQESDDF